ncbi:B3 domain-containing transcription repressor VAL1-like isoform X2 [Cornus florida]|uniref:B3 domain-containing transcription repressor VAL1-like isoform X2 n=1 Tax=Cornus florida TaxID=4283 RepID=UPI0028A22CEA|nr:B3 domain-containing transcription repressor VAL1-like isoform X2 [Cornus florida]
MADKICMNELCKAKTTLQWKKGWGFKSGGFATLCYNCGSAYENSVYCETFHVEESGWRECRYCRKHIHCGCIASKSLHDFLDFGGIVCISCAKGLQTRSMRPIQISNDDIPNGFGTLTTNNLGDQQSSVHEKRMDGISVDNGKVVQSSKSKEEKNLSHFLQTQKGETSSSMGQLNREDIMCPIGEAITGFSDLMQQPVGSSMFSSPDTCMKRQGVKDMYESVAQPSLKFSLSTPLSTPNSALPFPGGIVEGREQGKVPPFQQGPRTRHILPKPPKSGLTLGPEANKGFVSQTRVARPPAEGRGRNQLLPRYWPRITDQELQQLSGDLNSNIVPLFEKVLSASDAGRIGRLVLPKACAEAYFPPISQSEGLPLRIQDIKGKEWTFQFRFWPNNNSRMYVLEGVTPCIQNMQLQAGDTVTFSRIDPGGELVMGFRKASNSVDVQEDQTYVPPNGALSGETSIFNVNENLPTHAGRKNENSVQQPMLIPEKKRTRNIGSKSKRLLMHSEDAVELRVTWGEAQELLRSPPCEPTVFMVGDHEFEEYDDPPVFGKRTIFRAQPSGEQEQWAQCDSCSKWRKLPVDVLLPPKWMCSDNIWDSGRCSCSAPDEMNPKELESFSRVGKDVKKRRLKESHKVAQECEPSGLDALATAAVLGDNASDSGEPSVGVTTRHPRHRPGCSCIVCIQPPSGKGKHKPTCICNVCMTVKRRFKTLMMRKKKRQSEREAEVAQGRVQQVHLNDEPEMEDTSGHALQQMDHSDNERSQSRIHIELGESSKGQLDLNYHPNREEDQSTEATGANITSLVHEASFPLQMYLRQNGFAGFLGASLPSPTANKSEDHPPDEECLASVLLELENKDDGA